VAQRKLAEMMSNGMRVLQLQALSNAIHDGPRMVAQRHEIHALFGGALKPQEDGAMPAEATLAQSEEKTNKTGLPDQLKLGIESLSGMSMDHVMVHYNSHKPAQLQAHAYAQGSEIHLGAGQERHLPHEAWHVVQQAQGRVRPTLQMKASAINDDPSLEKEADMMGGKAAQFKGDHDARNLASEERVLGVVTQHVAGLIQRVHEPAAQGSNRNMGLVQENRKNALENMVAALEKENLQGLPPFTEIEFVYVDANVNANKELVEGDAGRRIEGVFPVKIYKGPFDKGMAVVYSTLRHELIHVAQYFKEEIDSNYRPAAAADLSSPVTASRSSRANQTDVYYSGSHDYYAEIETHCWEIINAEASGVDKEYLYGRAKALFEKHYNSASAKKGGHKDMKPLMENAKQVYIELMADPKGIPWPLDLSEIKNKKDAEILSEIRKSPEFRQGPTSSSTPKKRAGSTKKNNGKNQASSSSVHTPPVVASSSVKNYKGLSASSIPATVTSSSTSVNQIGAASSSMTANKSAGSMGEAGGDGMAAASSPHAGVKRPGLITKEERAAKRAELEKPSTDQKAKIESASTTHINIGGQIE
jgi:hypothetical protein